VRLAAHSTANVRPAAQSQGRIFRAGYPLGAGSQMTIGMVRSVQDW